MTDITATLRATEALRRLGLPTHARAVYLEQAGAVTEALIALADVQRVMRACGAGRDVVLHEAMTSAEIALEACR